MDLCKYLATARSPPKKKEQEYNPSKGRRDIRFFPEKETELLAVAAEDTLEAVELDSHRMRSSYYPPLLNLTKNIIPVQGDHQDSSERK